MEHDAFCETLESVADNMAAGDSTQADFVTAYLGTRFSAVQHRLQGNIAFALEREEAADEAMLYARAGRWGRARDWLTV